MAEKQKDRLRTCLLESVISFRRSQNYFFAFLVFFFADSATVSFKFLPATNAGTLVAGISITSLVAGLRPVLAGRSLTLKVPKPMRLTLLPSLSSLVMMSMIASTTS